MAELNPFEPPSDKPRAGGPVTDRELLALPDRGPLREAFGDRYFWPLVALVGLVILVVPWVLELPIQFKKPGLAIIAISLGGWVKERWKR